MGERLIDKIDAPGGKILIIKGDNHGAVGVDGGPPPLFVGLPPRPHPLIGRDAELAKLRAKVCGDQTTTVTALIGLPGVGKTALATTLAYDAAVSERFRGGVLWAGLGLAPNIDSALGRWADALDIELGTEPDSSAKLQRFSAALQERAQGEPVLLVLDDAWAWEHARPFLEIAFPGCAHLLTTRDAGIARRFAGEATWIGELTRERAEELLAARCPRAKEVDPDGLRDLALAVGGLPLALALIAAKLNDHAEQARWIRTEIARLSAAEARLGLEAPERRPGLEGVTNTLRAIVEMSVEALGAELRGAFEALGAFAPKPADFGPEAACAVWEVNQAVGQERLRRLVSRGMIEVASEGRFALHQVPAAVAAARLGDEEGPRAQHARFHCGLASRLGGDWRSIQQELGQIRQGWAWTSGVLRDEALVVDYSHALLTFFDVRGLWSEAVAWGKRALDATRILHDRGQEGALLHNLGIVHSSGGDTKHAQECFEQAMLIHHEVGNRRFVANTLISLGSLLGRTADGSRVREYCEQALRIYLEIGSRSGAATALNNLGVSYFAAGEYRRAREHFEQASSICCEVGDRAGEATALHNLGNVCAALKEDEKAREYYERALPIRQDLGDRFEEASTLRSLGRACTKLRDPKARAYHEQSLTICREMGTRADETKALNDLGNACVGLKSYDKAREHHERALTICREAGDRAGEAMALHNLGSICAELKDHDKAREHYQQSLTICREVGDRTGEASSLQNLGTLCVALGDHKRAREYHEQALPILREVSDRVREAFTLDYLGRSCSATGDRRSARKYHEQALPLHRELCDRAREAFALLSLARLCALELNMSGMVDFHDQLEQLLTRTENLQHPDLERYRTHVRRLQRAARWGFSCVVVALGLAVAILWHFLRN